MTPVEASLADLAAALAEGRTTAVALLAACLQRIAAHDRSGARLNAIPVLNPQAFAQFAGNAQAFQAAAKNAQNTAAMARNANAFQALAADANAMQALSQDVAA